MKYQIWIALILTLLGCKPRESSELSIQAADPAKEIHPAVVQIFKGADLEPHCTGSFVSRRILATAAHCIIAEESGEPYQNLALVIDGAVYSPSEGVVPEKYLSNPPDLKRAQDFGLLAFREDLSSHVIEIRDSKLPERLSAVEVVGYGDNAIFKVHTFSDETVERLVRSLRIQWSHKFDMWVHPGEHSIFSDKTFRKFDYGVPVSVLVNLNGGDSGGPALIDGKVIGVASQGENSVGYGLSSEYCSISPGSLHFSWLQSYLKGEVAKGIRKYKLEPNDAEVWSPSELDQITKDHSFLNENYAAIRNAVIKEYEQKFTVPPRNGND